MGHTLHSQVPVAPPLSAPPLVEAQPETPTPEPGPEPELSPPPLVHADPIKPKKKEKPPVPEEKPEKREPVPPVPPVPLVCPPGMVPTKSGRSCYEPIEVVQKRWKEDEDKELGRIINLFVDTTLTEGMENVSTFTGWFGMVAKMVPGGQGLALGLEFVGLTADVANVSYVIVKGLVEQPAPEGAKAVVEKTVEKGGDIALKATKKGAVKKLHKRITPSSPSQSSRKWLTRPLESFWVGSPNLQARQHKSSSKSTSTSR